MIVLSFSSKLINESAGAPTAGDADEIDIGRETTEFCELGVQGLTGVNVELSEVKSGLGGVEGIVRLLCVMEDRGDSAHSVKGRIVDLRSQDSRCNNGGSAARVSEDDPEKSSMAPANSHTVDVDCDTLTLKGSIEKPDSVVRSADKSSNSVCSPSFV